MNQPLLHPQTELLLQNHIKYPSHALLIIGGKGSGKLYTAQWLADQLQLETIVISALDDKQTIGIDQIKELYSHTKTGRPLCLIIEDAHTMTKEAQNAILKLLEEPPQNTYFVLTAANEHSILQTIRSRCQKIYLQAVANEVIMKEFADYVSDNLQPYITTTNKKIGYLSQILQNNELKAQHDALIATAKQFYASDGYARLKILQEHSYDKLWARELIDTLAIIIQALLSAPNNSSERIKKLTNQVSTIEAAAHALSIAGNPKVHLSRLALEL